MNRLPPSTSLAWDWYRGTIPQNAWIDETAYVESTFSFSRCRSVEPRAVEVGRGAATYLGTMFDLGPRARVRIGDFALANGVWFICDASIEIGDHSMLSWNVVLMDTYRASRDPERRRAELRAVPASPERDLRTAEPARPIRIGANVWIGFDVVVMPGVTIGDGSIVGARSVVFDDVPPSVVVAGNPARVVRDLSYEIGDR
jgi:acetyltransferase-like isoleucine patch superfamily enzyme